MKPLAFPDAAWHDLFSAATADKDAAPSEISLRYVERKNFTVPVTPYCSVSQSGGGHRSLYVTPTKRLMEYLQNNHIWSAYDTIYFKVVIRADNSALILSENNQILASHWLAIVPAETIP